MKKYLVTLLVLVAFAAVSSAFDLSTLNCKVVNVNGNASVNGFIKENSAGTEYCVDGEFIDASTGNFISMIPSKGEPKDADWDKYGNLWSATDKELIRVGRNDTASYLKTDGMPSNSLRTLECDSLYSRLIIGTDDHGIVVVKQDASGKPISYDNMLDTLTYDFSFHKVGKYLDEIWAFGVNKAFHYNGKNWVANDTNNSPVRDPYGAFVAVNGNAYVGCHDINQIGYIAAFDHQTGEWSKIIPDSGVTFQSNITQIVVDNQNALWFVCAKYLGRIDLATMENNRWPLDGSIVPWLNTTVFGQSAPPVLGVAKNGDLLIDGYNAIVKVTSANAVRWPTLAPKVSRGNFQIIGQIDPMGRLIKSFSSKNPVSGISFTLIRTAEGMKAVRTLIAR